jgi:signal transduction histidine kinase
MVTTATPVTQPGWLSRLRVYVVIVLVVDTVIAALITGLAPMRSTFFENFVYSQAIGLTILSLTAAPTLAMRNGGPRRRPLLLGAFAVAVPIGFIIGSELASRMLGVPSLLSPQNRGSGFFGGIVLVTIVASLACSTFFWTRERLGALQLEAARERERAAAERERAEAASRQATEAHLGLIRAQLEPHMLFNTLANLRSLIIVDPPRAQRMMDRLISYLRATLSASRHETVPLGAEFALLRDYLELIAIRMGPRLRYSLDLPAALADEPVLPMLLQPLVENAVRHGLEPAVDGGRIDVRASADDAVLRLVVEDTGVGFSGEARSTRGSGFGLEQIRERLRTAHGDLAGLAIASPRPAFVAAGDATVMGGEADDEGPGVRLELTLPRARAAGAVEPRRTPPAATTARPSPTATS